MYVPFTNYYKLVPQDEEGLEEAREEAINNIEDGAFDSHHIFEVSGFGREEGLNYWDGSEWEQMDNIENEEGFGYFHEAMDDGDHEAVRFLHDYSNFFLPDEGAFADEGVGDKLSEDQEQLAAEQFAFYALPMREENADKEMEVPEDQLEVASAPEATRTADIVNTRTPINPQANIPYFHENPLMTLALAAIATCTPLPLPEPPALTVAPKTDEKQWSLASKFASNSDKVPSYVKPTDVKDNISQILLEPKHTYKFRVASVSLVDNSDRSEGLAFETSSPGLPGAAFNVKIVRSALGIKMSWQPPPGNIVDLYSLYVGVKSLPATIVSASASASTRGTIFHSPALNIPFELVYRGPLLHCVVNNASLAKAHVDKTGKPTIIFRLAARNVQGYGPTMQVKWIPKPTMTVNAPPPLLPSTTQARIRRSSTIRGRIKRARSNQARVQQWVDANEAALHQEASTNQAALHQWLNYNQEPNDQLSSTDHATIPRSGYREYYAKKRLGKENGKRTKEAKSKAKSPYKK